MYSINKLPQAERDVEECFVYIGVDNVDVALAFLAAVDRALEHIARFPFSGVSRTYKSSDADDVRMWLVPDFENYSIFYVVRSETVNVVRVLHSARDIVSIFDKG